MLRTSISLLSPILAVIASQSLACSMVWEEPTAAQISQYRLDSKPVQVAPDCSFENAQVSDFLFAGGAEDLGSGRVLQRINETDGRVLVVDCSTREATLLEGPGIQVGEDSCGPTMNLDRLVGEGAILSMSSGETLQELVRLAAQLGAVELDPVEYFNTDPWGEPVSPKDHINLLCGCQIYYPDSPGATQ